MKGRYSWVNQDRKPERKVGGGVTFLSFFLIVPSFTLHPTSNPAEPSVITALFSGTHKADPFFSNNNMRQLNTESCFVYISYQRCGTSQPELDLKQNLSDMLAYQKSRPQIAVAIQFRNLPAISIFQTTIISVLTNFL